MNLSSIQSPEKQEKDRCHDEKKDLTQKQTKDVQRGANLKEVDQEDTRQTSNTETE